MSTEISIAPYRMKRKCDYCGKEYEADSRNLKRGWGLCCSKSCAARKREQSKPCYSKERVERNNIRRGLWNVWMETDRGQSAGDYDGADQDQWGDYFEHGV